MKYHLALLASGALVLMAADVWNSKPYTDWSDKDVQKITTDSPWAKKTSVMGTEGPAPPAMGGASGGGGRGGRGGGGGAVTKAPPTRLARMVRQAVPACPSAAVVDPLRSSLAGPCRSHSSRRRS